MKAASYSQRRRSRQLALRVPCAFCQQPLKPKFRRSHEQSCYFNPVNIARRRDAAGDAQP